MAGERGERTNVWLEETHAARAAGIVSARSSFQALIVIGEIGSLPTTRAGGMPFFQPFAAPRARLDRPDRQQSLRGLGRDLRR